MEGAFKVSNISPNYIRSRQKQVTFQCGSENKGQHRNTIIVKANTLQSNGTRFTLTVFIATPHLQSHGSNRELC